MHIYTYFCIYIYIYIYVYIYIYICHFKIHGRNFMKHAKFTLIEQLREISNVSEDTLRLRLKRREDFWIIKTRNIFSQGTKPRTA